MQAGVNGQRHPSSLEEFRHQSLIQARQEFSETFQRSKLTITRLRSNKDSFFSVYGIKREPLWDVAKISDELGTILHQCSSPQLPAGITVLRKKSLLLRILVDEELGYGYKTMGVAIPEGWVVAEPVPSDPSKVNVLSKLSSFEKFFVSVGKGRMIPREDASLAPLPQDIERAVSRIKNRATKLNKVDEISYETLRCLGTYPFFVENAQAAVALEQAASHSLSVDIVSGQNVAGSTELTNLLRITLAQNGHFGNKKDCLARHGYHGYEWAEMAVHYYLVRLFLQMLTMSLPSSLSYKERIVPRLSNYEATLREIASMDFASDNEYFLIEPRELRTFALALMKTIEVVRSFACSHAGDNPHLRIMDDCAVGGILSVYYGDLVDSVTFAAQQNIEYQHFSSIWKDLINDIGPQCQ